MPLQESSISESESGSEKRNKIRNRDKNNNMELSSYETSSINTTNKLTPKTYSLKDKIKYIQLIEKNGI